MLTKDLLRIGVKKGDVQPRWLSAEGDSWLSFAATLLDTFTQYEGKTRSELNAEIAQLTGNARDFKARRGLAKLLLDRTDFIVASDLDPSTVRQTVFELAAPHQPLDSTRRNAVLLEAAAALDTTPENVEASLYADLESNHIVGSMRAIDSPGLLHRYNVALVQGVLLRSKSLRIRLQSPTQKRLRQLIRYLKFYRLSHAAGQIDGCWEFVVDGPLSVLKQSTRYGVALANFFPALLMAERWSLEADYQPAPKARTSVLRLTSDDGLVSHYRDTGTWTAPEELALIERLRELAPDWQIKTDGELIDLDGRDVLVPDLTLVTPDGDVIYLELVWRWRRGDLKSRWKRLQKRGPDRFILAVSSAHVARLPSLEGPVHVFKGTPNARSILKLAREIAKC